MKKYFEEKRIRPDILTAAVYWAFIIMMIYEMVALRIYGDIGAGYAVGPLAIFYIMYLTFVLAVQKSVWVMVRLRARRSQFLNAETNMHRSFKIFAILGLFISCILIVSSFVISEFMLGNGRGMFQNIIVAICALLLCIQGVIRGYLQGIGYTKPIIISDLLISLISGVTGTIIAIVFYNYGLKVNSLFHVDDFSAVYGSSGMLIGIFIGSLAGLIQILVSFGLRKNEIKEIVKQSGPRYLDNKNDVLSSIKSIIFMYISPVLLIIVDQLFFVVYNRQIGAEADTTYNFGVYAGRVLPLFTTFVLLCCVPFIKSWNRIMARIERDELEGAKERYSYLINKGAKLVIPVSVFVFSVAETLEIAVFGKNNELSNSLIQFGFALIILGSFALFISWLFCHMGKPLASVICLAMAWIVHVVMLIIFVIVLKLGVYGLLFATMIALLIYDVISAFIINKFLNYRPIFIRSFGIPIACSSVSGLVIFFINKLFINLIGDILTLLICFLVFLIIYILLMIFTGGIHGNELAKIPFCKIFVRLAASFGRDNYEE